MTRVEHIGAAIPQAAILQAREHFAQIGRDCIAEAESGEVRVNDLASYREWRREGIRAVLAGEEDHTFAFRQMAHFFAFGECVPLLQPMRGAA